MSCRPPVLQQVSSAGRRRVNRGISGRRLQAVAYHLLRPVSSIALLGSDSHGCTQNASSLPEAGASNVEVAAASSAGKNVKPAGGRKRRHHQVTFEISSRCSSVD